VDQCQVWIDPVEKLDFQSYASYVEKIDLSDRTRIDDRDHGKGESTPEDVLRTECIEFFNRIGRPATANSTASPPDS